MKELNKKEVRSIVKQCDWMFWASIFMFLGMRVCVAIVFNITAIETGADIAVVHQMYELNPLYAALLRIEGINYLLQFFVIPASGSAIYLLFRRKVLFNNYSPDIVQFQVTFLFFMVLINFLHDLSSMVGRVL